MVQRPVFSVLIVVACTALASDSTCQGRSCPATAASAASSTGSLPAEMMLMWATPVVRSKLGSAKSAAIPCTLSIMEVHHALAAAAALGMKLALQDAADSNSGGGGGGGARSSASANHNDIFFEWQRRKHDNGELWALQLAQGGEPWRCWTAAIRSEVKSAVAAAAAAAAAAPDTCRCNACVRTNFRRRCCCRCCH